MDAAWHNGIKSGQIRIKINRNAMPADPAANADANRCNFIKPAVAFAIFNPDSGQAIAPLTGNAKGGKAGNDPAFQPMNKGAHILTAATEVKHNIGNTLARPMPGPLAAAPDMRNGHISGCQKIMRLCRCATGINRLMLKKPYSLGSGVLANGGCTCLHFGQKWLIGLETGKMTPCQRQARHGRWCGVVICIFRRGCWRHGYDPVCKSHHG